jgi:flagellin
VRANQGQTVGVALDDMSTAGLRIQKLDVSNRLAGQNGIKMIDDAIQKLSTQRANVGALQNRISSTISANELNIINQRSAESRIRDVDFAEETLSFTRNNILIQSGTAVLAQANAAPQSVLSLLR